MMPRSGKPMVTDFPLNPDTIKTIFKALTDIGRDVGNAVDFVRHPIEIKLSAAHRGNGSCHVFGSIQ